MSNQDNYVVIMAGGVGSRFWPYSRNQRPKQFLDILGTGRSLLQMTYDRFLNICPVENIYIVSNAAYEEQIKEQLPALKAEQVLLEPARRNTAPCIAYACYKISQRNANACVVVSPSDHAIFNEQSFFDSINTSIEAANAEDRLLTLGIKPHRPETGYGYIQYIPNAEQPYKKVKTFTEKPNLELAKKFVDSGEFVWNSGIFIWTISSIRKAFEQHMPEMAEIFEDGTSQYYTDKEDEFINKAYSHCKNISIDYGIMEKASNVYTVLGEFGWSDLGSWNSLHEHFDKDENNNAIDADVILYDTKNSFIKGPEDKLMVVQGLDNYLVAECENVLLICQKDLEKQFREFVKDVKNKKGEKYI